MPPANALNANALNADISPAHFSHANPANGTSTNGTSPNVISSRVCQLTCGAAMLAGTWLLGSMGAIAQSSSSFSDSAFLANASYSSVTPAAMGRTVRPVGRSIAQANAPTRTPRLASAANEYKTLYVDAQAGSDRAEGVESEPLQTVTRALEIAQPNTVIVLAPGRYNQSSGETFPLQLKPGITIQGAPGARERSAIIEGGGTFESPTRSLQNAAILAADRAGIAQVAVSNPDGYGIWIESGSPTILETAFVGNRQTGIYVTGGSPRVQNNYFSGNQVAGLIVFGISSANIVSNTFDSTGDAIRVAEGATPEIVGNRITNNNASLVLIGDVAPVVRNNQIVGNRRDEVLRVATGSRELRSVSAISEAGATRPQAGSATAPSVARKVPIPADAVPGELAGNGFGNLPMLASPVPTAPPVQRLAAAQSISRPLVASPRLPAVPSPPPVEAAEVAEVADNLVADADLAPSIDAESEAIPAGSPGAALAALQSSVALSPRAVSGENPDSPILRRRRNRRRRNEEIDNRVEPVNRPSESIRSPLPPVNNNRLSVPSSRIPLGSGSSSIIFSPPSGGVGGPPAPPSRAQALGLYYRVFVETADPFEQDGVREVVRDAFRTQFDGRTVMQVGAFPTEDEAVDRQRILEDNGFNARIEYIR
ncbi:MAG: DUF1565 domain-containing protein [Phormidesmis sp.]